MHCIGYDYFDKNELHPTVSGKDELREKYNRIKVQAEQQSRQSFYKVS